MTAITAADDFEGFYARYVAACLQLETNPLDQVEVVALIQALLEQGEATLH